MDEISVGQILSMALATKILSTVDLSGKTAFGWTGVPIRVIVNEEQVDFEAEFVPRLDRIELRVS